MNRELLAKADEINDRYIQMWIDICSIESPTDCKQGVDEVGKYFVERATDRGWDVEIHREDISGDCISITMNQESEEAPVVFSGHMDTVHAVGSFGRNRNSVVGGSAYGIGTGNCNAVCKSYGVCSDFFGNVGKKLFRNLLSYCVHTLVAGVRTELNRAGIKLFP